ncbi:hypothetical protein [Rhizobium leguminosarum]
MAEFIATSAFAPSGPRPAPVYNRTTITLIVAVLFDHTFVIPMSSMVEAPVLYEVFGPFAAARRALGYRDITPLRLSVDNERHFNREDRGGISHVTHRALHAYLCGRAHHKRNLWEGSEVSFQRQFSPNFGFIDKAFMEDDGRGYILSMLEQNDATVMEKFSLYIRDNFEAINSYFYTSPGALTDANNIFVDKSYRDYAAPVIMSLATDLDNYYQDRKYVASIEKIFGHLDASNRFNMNAMAPIGREHIESWDEIFQPLINAHRWSLDAKLCGADQSQNIEIWGVDNLSLRDSMLSALREDGVAEVVDVSLCRGGDVANRVEFDQWQTVLEIRNGKGREFLSLMRQEPEIAKRNLIASKYIEYAAQQLAGHVNLLDVSEGKCSVSIGSSIFKTSHAIFNLALSGVGSFGGAYAGWSIGSLVSDPARGAGYGAAIGASTAAVVKDYVKGYWDDVRTKLAGDVRVKKRIDDNVRVLKLHSAWIDHYDG